MIDIACIIRTIDGFITMRNYPLNRDSDNYFVNLEKNNTLIIFYSNVTDGRMAFDEFKTDIHADDNFTQIIQKIEQFLKNNKVGKEISLIACGFDDDPKIYGISHYNSYNLNVFNKLVTLDKDVIFDFYQEILYPNRGTSEEALLFIGAYLAKLNTLSYSQNNHVISVSTYSGTVVLDKAETAALLTKGAKFHSAVRRKSSNIFLGERE